MPTERRGRSLVEHVYTVLRERIIMGEFGDGEQLHLAALAGQFDVSLGVVREAVTRLGSEELVVATPQQGFRIRPLSVPDLLDLTWVRCELETLALAQSIEHGTLEWEAELVAAHHMLGATPTLREEGTFNPDWMRAHARFHGALVAACQSPILIRLRQELFDASEIYRYWVDVKLVAAKRDVPDEHKKLVEATLARDADTATALLRGHIQRTADVLLEAHRASPEYREPAS